MGSILVQNIGKAYKQYPTRWSRALEWMLPFAGKRHHLKWILRDINFHIAPGEAVALIQIFADEKLFAVGGESCAFGQTADLNVTDFSHLLSVDP